MEYNFKGMITENDFIKYGKMLNQTRNIIYTCIVYFILVVYSFLNSDVIYAEFKYHLLIQQDLFLAIYNTSSIRFIVLAFIASTLIMIMRDLIFAPMNFKKLYKSNKAASLERIYSITEEHIQINRENGTSRITKDSIRKIKPYKDVVYIFISINEAIIIKRDYFASEDNYNEFLLFLDKNFNPKIKSAQ